MKLIAGLGNPGEKHEKNRHNLGFMVLDELAKQYKVEFKNCRRTLSRRTVTAENGKKIMLAKPETFMNESGQALSKLVSYYKIKPEDIWVVFDDLDLPLGKIRLREKGSAGGHKGIASIIEYLKTDRFNRLKIGLGSNREKGIKAEKYVLQNFTKAEEKIIREAVKKAADTLKEKV